MSGHRDYAKHLLKHYFRIVAEKAGARLDADCYTEIEEIVDAIIDAAKEEISGEIGESRE